MTAPPHDLAYVRMAVEAYLIKGLTYKECSERFNIPHSTMCYYVKRFSDEILQTNVKDMQSNNQEQNNSAQDSENQDNEAHIALANANRKIAALEILIQVAEEELGINIRKKYGTRQ